MSASYLYGLQKAKEELEILSYNLIQSNSKKEKNLLLLDPNVPIHEQIDLLSYDTRWEFPIENLNFVSILGHGAFGKGK